MTYGRLPCSNSSLRATKFSATRLPISCGDVPAGQSRKYDWADTQGRMIRTIPIAKRNATGLRCRYMIQISFSGYSVFLRSTAVIVIDVLFKPGANAARVILPAPDVDLIITKQRP